jgi:DNA polymerase I
MSDNHYPDTWFAIDGNNSIFKDVVTGDITATRFRRRIECLNQKWHPERIIVAFDPDDGSSFRRELYGMYKSKRGPKPEGLEHAIDSAKQVCRDECIDFVCVPGFEADDILATIVDGALSRSRRCVMFSSDKDLRQLLLSGHVTQCTELKRSGDEFHPVWFKADEMLGTFGVIPEQWIEYQAIAGDSSDCIPGVKGIGKQGAQVLLEKYRSIANFFAKTDAEKNPDATTRKMRAARNDGTLELMLQLVTLRSDVPIGSAMMEMECAQ